MIVIRPKELRLYYVMILFTGLLNFYFGIDQWIHFFIHIREYFIEAVFIRKYIAFIISIMPRLLL